MIFLSFIDFDPDLAGIIAITLLSIYFINFFFSFIDKNFFNLYKKDGSVY